MKKKNSRIKHLGKERNENLERKVCGEGRAINNSWWI